MLEKIWIHKSELVGERYKKREEENEKELEIKGFDSPLEESNK